MSLLIPEVKPSLSTGAASQYQLINVKIPVEHEGEMLRVGFRIVQNLQMNSEKTVPLDSIRLSHCKNPYLQSHTVECHKGFDHFSHGIGITLTTVDGRNPKLAPEVYNTFLNNGIFAISTDAGFRPSTAVLLLFIQ